MKSNIQDFKFISNDLLLINWISLNPSSIDLEVESALWRNLVETKYFTFQFLEELNPVLAEKFTDHNYYDKEGKTFSIKQIKEDLQSFRKILSNRR